MTRCAWCSLNRCSAESSEGLILGSAGQSLMKNSFVMHLVQEIQMCEWAVRAGKNVEELS